MGSISLFAIPQSKYDSSKTEDSKIAELIKRRRRQILVHSFIYYELNQNIVSDAQWSAWAQELEELQSKYPDISDKTEFASDFKGFDHSTGANLRDAYNKPNIVTLAFRLLSYKE